MEPKEADGLETDGVQHPLLAKIVRFRLVLSLLCFLVAGVYTSVLVEPEWAERTRISENALLPGIADESYTKGSEVRRLSNVLESAGSGAHAAVVSQLRSWGIEAHEWTYRTPQFLNSSGLNHGRLSYGVLRGMRSSDTEAVFFGTLLTHDKRGSWDAALVLSLMAHLREQLHHSHSVVVVFADSLTGMEAFVSEYCVTPHRHIRGDRLLERAGSLLGGVFVKSSESPRSGGTWVGVSQNGVNGQMSNLDLVNLVSRVAHNAKYQLPVGLFGMEPAGRVPRSRFAPLHREQVLAWRSVQTQALVPLEGLHSVLASRGISAITLTFARGVSEQLAGRVTEGVLRSLNNLVEKFHQSYPFYLMVDEHRFLSIAYYAPVLAVWLGPLLVYLYVEWSDCTSVVLSPAIVVATVPFVLVYTVLDTALQWPQTATTIMSVLTESAQLLALVWIVTLVVASRRFVWSSTAELSTARLALYYSVGLLLGAVSMLNFSLALLWALPTVPLTLLLTRPAANSFPHRIVRLLAAVASTLLFAPLLGWSPPGGLTTGVAEWRRICTTASVGTAIKQMIVSWETFGQFSWPLFCLLVCPLVSLTLLIAFAPASSLPREAPTRKEKTE